MVRRQALGWLGAAVCSVALVVAGGLVLSSIAVHRYLQASASQLQRGDTLDTGTTPVPGELASLQRAVSALNAMPGVDTASSTVATSSSPKTISYDVAVTMETDATMIEGADVVYTLTQELQNGRVNLELTLPANDLHAESVIEYRNAFDTPVARSTVESVANAVEIAAAVPGVRSVHVTVPYTWNPSAGDLDVQMATDDSQQSAALRDALSRTAFADFDWSALQGASGSAAPSPASPTGSPATTTPRQSASQPPPSTTTTPKSTATPHETDSPVPSSTPSPTMSSSAPTVTAVPISPKSSHRGD